MPNSQLGKKCTNVHGRGRQAGLWLTSSHEVGITDGTLMKRGDTGKSEILNEHNRINPGSSMPQDIKASSLL